MPLKLTRRPGQQSWYVRGTINNRRYDESTGTSDRSLADAYRLKRENEIHREAIYGKSATSTFEEALQHYVQHGGCERFLEPLKLHFGHTKLANIGQVQIDAAAMKLLPNCSAATRNRQVYTPVSTVLHHAAALGWCAAPVIKRPRSTGKAIRWLSKSECDKLLEHCADHLRPLVLFLFYTGARMGEALWLDWKNVDLDRRHVQFIDTKNGTSRGVPLHRRVVAVLRKTNYRSGCVFRTHMGNEYARPNPNDERDVSAGTRIKTAFQAACRRAGIENFTPHGCRHTWATWHYIENRDLGALMRLGGWKTMSMVMRYAHVNVDELSRTIDAL